ncbi:MAG: helix-turn-helix domain-containing protein [Porticoccaceae bacterium]|nr:helix-turn-helix domain-containing protein [Porticoccaceae bacterium]
MKTKDYTITREYQLRGINRAARELRVSPGHLSRVIRGERTPGKELARKLQRLGIHYETADTY